MTRELKSPIAAIVLLGVVAVACSPASNSATPGGPTVGPTAAASVPAPSATPVSPTLSGPTVAPTPSLTTAVPTAGGPVTTYSVVMDEGPRVGTWDVTYQGEVAGCGYLPDLDRWISTWLGPPPLTFVDARGDPDDAYFLVSFDRDLPTATSMRPLGEVTFDVDDRGDTATLTFVSDENEADFDDGSPSETFGPIELTIECGSIFRYP